MNFEVLNFVTVTYQLISNGIADMHCFSDGYLAEELEMEWKESKVISEFPKGS